MPIDETGNIRDDFSELVRLQRKTVELKEIDLEKRAESDVVARQDKMNGDKSTLDNLTIDLRKANRAINERLLSTAGSFIGVLHIPDQGKPSQPLLKTVAVAKGLLDIFYAVQDRNDIAEKHKSYTEIVDTQNSSNNINDKPSNQESRTQDRAIRLAAGGATGPG